jgi:rubrerythrin
MLGLLARDTRSLFDMASVCPARRFRRFLDFLKADKRTQAKGCYLCRVCGGWHAIGDRRLELAQRRGYGAFCKRVAA